jgi:hypothetical protein
VAAVRIARFLLVLAGVAAAVALSRALLTRSLRDDAAAQAGMDRWPPVPRKPEKAA